MPEGNASEKQQRQRPDRRKRSATEAITHHERRNLWAAFLHSIKIGRPTTCAIDFHPIFMGAYPKGELSTWFKDELRNRIATWARRQKIGWYAIWTRENYAGNRREHLHLMVYCPPQLREDLVEAIRRWYPGEPQMVKLTVMAWRRHPSGRVACRPFEYRLKQMTTQAQGPPRLGRPRREVANRHDGSPVAPVNGLRSGVSKTLDKNAREKWEGEI